MRKSGKLLYFSAKKVRKKSGEKSEEKSGKKSLQIQEKFIGKSKENKYSSGKIPSGIFLQEFPSGVRP